MNDSRARWSNLQLTWIVIWLASIVTSLFLYWDKIPDIFKDKTICSITGIGTGLYGLASPRNWFGLIALALTIGGALWIWQHFSERWPFVAQYKVAVLVVLSLLIALLFKQGC